MTGKLASCWFIPAAKARISSAVPMSFSAIVSIFSHIAFRVSLRSVCDCGKTFFSQFGLRRAGRGIEQAFSPSPSLWQRGWGQYCLSLAPGHDFKAFITKFCSEILGKRKVCCNKHRFLNFILLTNRLQSLFFPPFWRPATSVARITAGINVCSQNSSVLSNSFVVKSLPP